jgi:hypothetical protein
MDLYIAASKLYCLPFVLGNPFKLLHKPNVSKIDRPSDDTVMYFLNGIYSDNQSIYRNTLLLENVFNRQVIPLINPTDGLIKDIKECIFGRTLNKIQQIDIELSNIVSKSLDNHSKVIIIAHSQGAIIANNILKEICNHPNIENLELYTFASASDEIIQGNYYVEHFANGYDYVAQIGVLEYIGNHHGRIYCLSNECGHLLYPHYITNLIEGKYCRGKSRLYNYLLLR